MTRKIKQSEAEAILNILRYAIYYGSYSRNFSCVCHSTVLHKEVRRMKVDRAWNIFMVWLKHNDTNFRESSETLNHLQIILCEKWSKAINNHRKFL